MYSPQRATQVISAIGLRSAFSVTIDMMKQMMGLEGVHAAKFDFCQLGMKTTNATGQTQTAKKRTTLLTNSAYLAKVLRQPHDQILHGLLEAECGELLQLHKEDSFENCFDFALQEFVLLLAKFWPTLG